MMGKPTNDIMKKQKQKNPLMQAADELFWNEVEMVEGTYDQKKYVIIDSKKQEVIVENVRLLGEKKVEV